MQLNKFDPPLTLLLSGCVRRIIISNAATCPLLRSPAVKIVDHRTKALPCVSLQQWQHSSPLDRHNGRLHVV